MSAQPACCPSCGAAGPFEFVDVVLAPVCVCGHVFEDQVHALTAVSDFATEMGYGYNASRQNAAYDQLVAMRRLGFGAAASDESRRINRELYDLAQLTQLKGFLRIVIGRLTEYTSAHPLFERVLGLFQQLKAATLAPEYQPGVQGAQGSHVRLPARTPRLTWGYQSEAAIAACTYAIFREDDAATHHARNYSMQLVASCAGRPFCIVRRWFRCLIAVLPQRFAGIQADEPILHVDQVVKWLSQQVVGAANDGRVLSSKHTKLLAGVDFTAAADLARALAQRLLGAEPLRSQVQAKRFRTSPGEWAYYVVIWAIAGLKQQRLLGKDWIKRDLVLGSLGVALGGGESEHDGDSDDDDVALGDLPDTHIALFHDIGRVIAQRAAQLPWVAAGSSGARVLSRDAKRNKKQLSLPCGGAEQQQQQQQRQGEEAQAALILKKGDEVKYIRQVVDFGCAERAPAPSGRGMASHSSRRDVSETDIKVEHCDDKRHGHDDDLDEDNDARAALHTRHVALAMAASLLVESDPEPSTRSTTRPSYTSSHWSALAHNTALIDSLSDQAVDALLFAPGEMEGYLRSEDEVRVVKAVREERGDWDVPCAAARGEKRARTRGGEADEEEEQGEEVLEYLEDSSGGERQPPQQQSQPRTGMRASRGKKKPRRTKATAALLAAARGDVFEVEVVPPPYLGVAGGNAQGVSGGVADGGEEEEVEVIGDLEEGGRDAYGLMSARRGGSSEEEHADGYGYDEDQVWLHTKF